VWHRVEDATQKILDGVTIGDLAARELQYDRQGGRYVI
jgi:DNA-binding IscR family transcriptional regulator